MLLPAPTQPLVTPSLDLLIAVEILFWLFVPICFVCVANYVVRQIQLGRLIENENAPLPFHLPAVTGWFFIICVLELIFLQSPLYLLLVPLGLAGVLVGNARTASQQFGFERLPAHKVFAWALLVCGAVILVEVPLMDVATRLLTALHLPHPEQQAVETFRHLDRAQDIFLLMFQAVFLAPLIEELFFRGFLFTFLKNYTSTWLALVLSAGIFAFVHANLGSAIPLWFLGVVLGLAYQHTGSLLLPMCIHGCFNLITALNLLLDKGN